MMHGWGMGWGMGVFGLLVLVALVLAIAALLKYLAPPKADAVGSVSDEERASVRAAATLTE